MGTDTVDDNWHCRFARRVSCLDQPHGSGLGRPFPSGDYDHQGWFCRDDQPEVVYQIQGVPGTWSVNPGQKFLESDLYVNIVIIWADPEKDATAVRDLFGVP